MIQHAATVIVVKNGIPDAVVLVYSEHLSAIIGHGINCNKTVGERIEEVFTKQCEKYGAPKTEEEDNYPDLDNGYWDNEDGTVHVTIVWPETD